MIILDFDIAPGRITTPDDEWMGYDNGMKRIAPNLYLSWENLSKTAIVLATMYLNIDVVDKNGNPQILHANRVAEAVKDAYKDKRTEERETLYIVGMLHDILEDTDCPRFLVRKLFGNEIYDAVVAITRQPDEIYKDYIHRCCRNEIARKVKKYDILDNLRPDRYCKEAPIKRYFDSLRIIYEYEVGLHDVQTL